MVGRSAHGAARTDGELACDLGGHAVEPLLADLDEGLAGEQPRLRRRGEVEVGSRQLGRKVLGRAGSAHPRPEDLDLAIEGRDLSGRLVRGGEPGLEVGERQRDLLLPERQSVELGRDLATVGRRLVEPRLELGGLTSERTHTREVVEDARGRTVVLGHRRIVGRGCTQQLAQRR